jgi:diguanylate cyclase (GGDEF)-like protein/PAS domain S-box-containing protein
MPLVAWFVLLAAVMLLLALVTRPRRSRTGSDRSGAGAPRRRPFRQFGAALLWRSRLASDTQRLLDALSDAVITVDQQGLILAANQRAAEILCPDRPYVATLFHDALLVDVIGPDLENPDRESLVQWWDRVLDQGFAREFRPEDCEVFVASCDRAPDEAVGLEVLEVRGSLSQPQVILKVSQGPLRLGRVGVANSSRFVRVFDTSPQPMAILDILDGVIVEANSALAEMLGCDHASLIGRSLREFTHLDDVAAVSDQMARLELGAISVLRAEQRLRRADGEYRVAAVRIDRMSDREVAVHLSDITEVRATARQLSHRERHDELTGLLNRRAVVAILEELVAEAPADTLGVVLVDIDNFKDVNDSIGHVLGDVVLQQLAARLQMVTLGSDLLARVGADEFVVVLDGAGQRVDARAAADRALRSIKSALVVEGEEMFLTASVGYVVAGGQESAEHLLGLAEVAMQQAKAAGKDNIINSRQSDAARAGSVLRITSELRRSIERGELVPFFQPILSLRSGRVTGYEVLARWQHPERGLLGPGEFMTQAEDSGVMLQLGAAMLQGALWQLREWRLHSAEFDRRTVSVNVATRQLTDPGFFHTVVDILEEVGIGGDSLWLEITETSLLSDVKGVMAALTDLRSLGIRLAVDDFGTGYSSLTYLKRFPVEAIKIDRSFVSGLGNNADDSAIVDAVVRLGSALNLTVVAEGVETKAQAVALQALGCDRGQGYLFGRPVAASAVSRI